MMNCSVWLLGVVLTLGLLLGLAEGDDGSTQQAVHQDARCLCKCPDAAIVTDSYFVLEEPTRSIYINSTVGPSECDCRSVVLSHLDLTHAQADAFCPRCRCKYEVRNLTIMKVVVVLVIWVITILVIYMGFLSCLDPMLNKKLSPVLNYSEQRNDESEAEDIHEPDDNHIVGENERRRTNATPMRTYGSSVMNRVGDRQSKWKQQVEVQRRAIYDDHSMLN